MEQNHIHINVHVYMSMIIAARRSLLQLFVARYSQFEIYTIIIWRWVGKLKTDCLAPSLILRVWPVLSKPAYYSQIHNVSRSAETQVFCYNVSGWEFREKIHGNTLFTIVFRIRSVCLCKITFYCQLHCSRLCFSLHIFETNYKKTDWLPVSHYLICRLFADFVPFLSMMVNN